MHKNFVKIGRVVGRGQTNARRLTDKQTRSSQYFAALPGAKYRRRGLASALYVSVVDRAAAAAARRE